MLTGWIITMTQNSTFETGKDKPDKLGWARVGSRESSIPRIPPACLQKGLSFHSKKMPDSSVESALGEQGAQSQKKKKNRKKSLICILYVLFTEFNKQRQLWSLAVVKQIYFSTLNIQDLATHRKAKQESPLIPRFWCFSNSVLVFSMTFLFL